MEAYVGIGLLVAFAAIFVCKPGPAILCGLLWPVFALIFAIFLIATAMGVAVAGVVTDQIEKEEEKDHGE